jgi:4-amino-4-deoxy-L-arabinose transferase-like glycosyltransferase
MSLKNSPAMIREKLKNNSFVLYIAVIILILFRLLLIAKIPLLDKTEARYAEIARIMWDTNKWIMPQIDYGIPFWAKPPLSTWLSALSYIVFGVNEFASRLPSFLLNIALVIITGKMVKKSGMSFYLPGFILLTMPEFLIHTGVVSTDTALLFCVTIMMISFWKTMDSDKKTYWNYLFFAALGLGLLAKGPLIMVLTFPPLFIWCCLEPARFKAVFSKFSVFIGIIITAVIAIPWYYFAEKETPGFLDYFIIGEHYKRFVVSGWKGDLYGKPKTQPLGMIWAFMIAFGFPWVQIVFYKIWKNRKIIFKDSWLAFLVLWLLWTPVFFTISKNILHTYMLPITVPIMFLMVYWWEDFSSKKVLLRTALIFPTIIFITYFAVFATGKIDFYMNSDKYILEQLMVKKENVNLPIYYWKEKNYSGQFYTNGKAQLIKEVPQFDSVFKRNKKLILITLKKEQEEIPKKYLDQMVLTESNYKTAIFVTK